MDFALNCLRTFDKMVICMGKLLNLFFKKIGLFGKSVNWFTLSTVMIEVQHGTMLEDNEIDTE